MVSFLPASSLSFSRFLLAVFGMALLFATSGEASPRVGNSPRKPPRILEQGFKVEGFRQCEWNGPVRRFLPQRDQIEFRRPRLTDMECGNGSWGERLHMAYVDGLFEGEPHVVLSRMDERGHVAAFTWFASYDFQSWDMSFSPPSWREGEELFVTIWPTDIYNPSSNIWTFRPDGSQGSQAWSFPNTRIGSGAVDPTGAFGGDFYYSRAGELLRQDAGGVVTLFAAIGTLGDMRFGPGGAWGDDLYMAGSVVAPDGSVTPFPVGFSEFDWAPGPGFDGDMFVLSDGQVLRVTPDGSASVFVERAAGPIAWCDGALWLGGPNGCWRITSRGQ